MDPAGKLSGKLAELARANNGMVKIDDELWQEFRDVFGPDFVTQPEPMEQRDPNTIWDEYKDGRPLKDGPPTPEPEPEPEEEQDAMVARITEELKAMGHREDDEDEAEPETQPEDAAVEREMMPWTPIMTKDIILVKHYRREVEKDIEIDMRPHQEGDEQEFEVEYIGALGLRKQGTQWDDVVVNIKWTGYGYDDMTWESIENVISKDVLPEAEDRMIAEALAAAPVTKRKGSTKGRGRGKRGRRN